MINEMRFSKGVISANNSSASWNRSPSRTSSSMDGMDESKKGVIDGCETRKSIPCSSRRRRFFSFGQAKSEGNESAPETWRPKTVLGPSGFWESISNHRVESCTERRDICDRATPTSSPRAGVITCKIEMLVIIAHRTPTYPRVHASASGGTRVVEMSGPSCTVASVPVLRQSQGTRAPTPCQQKQLD